MKEKRGYRKRPKLILIGLMILIIAVSLSACSMNNTPEGKIDKVISKMSLDEKISQMIIPAIRTWDEENVTELDACPELSEVLQRHQYGGIILFGANISGNEQVAKLLYDLQENNSAINSVKTHIPYLTPVDEEGGIVIRLSSGTRMTGNMALGATGDAEVNAGKTGEIIGEELSALGFNTDFAPDIDVNNNPANPVIGTRSFSDDPETVAKLGLAYSEGLSKDNIIATYKHFPGHGDTGVDSHIGTPSVEKTYEELLKTELVPFKTAIENGADMIMTAHITYPLIDEEVTFGDGVTKGYYPATMSKKMLTDILRNDLGFSGVVVTDALEMDAIRTAGLVPGEEDSTEYRVNIAEKVIDAGADILLLPADLKDADAATFYDEYIAGIAAKVKSGEISKDRINESVKRILQLKAKYGIFDPDKKNNSSQNGNGQSVEEKIESCKGIVGSEAHHETEMSIAKDAITLIKNDELLPLNNEEKKIAFLCRLKDDENTLNYIIDELKKTGAISASSDVSVDYYYDNTDSTLNYTDEMKATVSSADIVIGFSHAAGSSALDTENPQYIALSSAIEDTHKAGGKFILISQNLPYDAAIYQDADAIILAYLGSGLGIDPTEKTDSASGIPARNANIIAAVDTVFGLNDPKGHLPVNIPVVESNADGSLKYGDKYLYERGFGLSLNTALPKSKQAIHYENAKVSYLGPEGTYTQEACSVFFDKKGSYIPYETVADAVDALLNGDSEYAVIPQENTIGGPVIDYVDIVVGEESVSIAGEIELPINQNLLVRPGTELKNIKKVYSHKQGIAQGKEWLTKNLPDAEIIEVSSTAEGAKKVSEEKDETQAAIASAACADVYGLTILAQSIQNNDSNKTRFYVLSKDEPAKTDGGRLVFIASGKAGDLPSLMTELDKQGMKLITIHDRPKKTILGEYDYLIECADCDYENYEKLTGNSFFEFRYLGSFEVK